MLAAGLAARIGTGEHGTPRWIKKRSAAETDGFCTVVDRLEINLAVAIVVYAIADFRAGSAFAAIVRFSIHVEVAVDTVDDAALTGHASGARLRQLAGMLAAATVIGIRLRIHTVVSALSATQAPRRAYAVATHIALVAAHPTLPAMPRIEARVCAAIAAELRASCAFDGATGFRANLVYCALDATASAISRVEALINARASALGGLQASRLADTVAADFVLVARGPTIAAVAMIEASVRAAVVTELGPGSADYVADSAGAHLAESALTLATTTVQRVKAIVDAHLAALPGPQAPRQARSITAHFPRRAPNPAAAAVERIEPVVDANAVALRAAQAKRLAAAVAAHLIGAALPAADVAVLRVVPGVGTDVATKLE